MRVWSEVEFMEKKELKRRWRGILKCNNWDFCKGGGKREGKFEDEVLDWYLYWENGIIDIER